MWQRFVRLAAVVSAGGCSILFNPNNIAKQPIDAAPKMDAPPPDMMIDADMNPADLKLMDVFPATINEGAGTSGSRPAIVALHGNAFLKAASANLTVTITPSASVTIVGKEISSDGSFIVLSLTVPVDTTCDTGTIPLTVSVMETGATAAATLSNALAVACLPQLKDSNVPASTAGLAPLYSTIDLTGAFPAITGSAPLILRSVSHISLGGALDVSASGVTPGPGGGAGGDDTPQDGSGPGGGKGNTNGGGGGGFVTAGGQGGGTSGGAGGAGMLGDPFISSYAMNVPSGGGGGGRGICVSCGTTHSNGGGGGGVVELTAVGDVSLTSVTANGGNGTITTGATVNSGGGAGTGGVILVRAGGNLTLSGSLSVTKGSPGGSGTSAGGTASDGRIRVDSATGAQPTQPSGLTLGPMITSAPPLNTTYPTILLRGPSSSTMVTVIVHDKDDFAVGGNTYNPTFTNGLAMIPMITLKEGYNKICATVPGGSTSESTVPEANNCVEVGYAP